MAPLACSGYRRTARCREEHELSIDARTGTLRRAAFANMSKPLAVLIIDDSATDARLVVRQLRKSGFSPEWERVDTATALRHALRRREWGLVISDSGTPHLNALEALTLVKEEAPGTPFIVVSGTISEELAVQAIRSGASDYVTKENLARLGSAIDRELAAIAPASPSARGLLQARDAERRRIAHELHDQIGQLLVGVRLNLVTAQQQRGLARLRSIEEAKSLVDDVIDRVRDFSFDLYPAVLEDEGLAAALRWLARRRSRWSGLKTEIEVADVPPLPRALQLACFRVAQEALSNVSRHAEARSVRVELRILEGEVELVIRDDGKGFDVDAAGRHVAVGTHLGLAGMQQRAALASGRLEIESGPVRGTTVRARFPVPRTTFQ
jgi:signal transduction histidine kinase